MVYLYIWAIVVAGSGGREYVGWVNQGGYESRAACDNAAKVLEVKIHRCVPGGVK